MSITDSDIRLSYSPGQIRPSAVAGTFYPADTRELHEVVRSLLDDIKVEQTCPKALISPHAGYIYSGSTAARAYASLRSAGDRISRVVLLGPAHRVYVKGLALPTSTAFSTPLGNIPIDEEAADKIRHLPQVKEFDEAHTSEHSLEVQLPFLQEALGEFLLLPLVVGEASAEEVAEVLDILWGGEETLIVISSDLSHFHDYRSSQRIDTATANSIEALRYEELDPYKACGAYPVQGLLYLARRKKMQAHRLGLCNSGDTAGGHDRVVGYGAWSFEEIKSLSEEFRVVLKDIARRSIKQGFESKRPLNLHIEDYPRELRRLAATFVTLKIDGNLRGCIGTTEAVQPMVTSIADSAFKAAFHDPRFNPLSEEEFRNVDLSISVLSAPVPLLFASEEELISSLRPGIDGLTILKGSHRATFLPAVWESLPERHDFLSQLKLKAGLKKDEPIEKAWRYSTESFS